MRKNHFSVDDDTEAEELRRAVGMRRSMQRMKDLEGRLREGMARNGIGPEAQDNIVQGISSFAMYGFPESHAASFALIAYASAYLKVHYLAAFTCAMLNNQPMGFYSPAVLIKDAQRHGLRVRPIDIQRSEWLCTLEAEPDGSLSLRIGLNYAKGLRQSSAEALLSARSRDGAFASVDDLALRISALNRKELVALARIGALNSLDEVAHRRDALWQVEEAGRPVGPLLRNAAAPSIASLAPLPLRQMTTDERLAADYSGTGLTTGPHPMAYHRPIIEGASTPDAFEEAMSDLLKELHTSHLGFFHESARRASSRAALSATFRDIPEAIANTRIVSDRLDFTLNDLGYEFPHYPVPDRETMDSFLAKRVEEGVRKRYGSQTKRQLLDKARAQVQHELALIAKLGFAGYFLIVWDIIRYCQQQGFLVHGRGSAANSAVCYALEITAVDPVGRS